MPTLSVIVPCHNELPVLPLLFERVKLASVAWGIDHELVCVDDGSTDGTWGAIQAEASKNPSVRGVRLTRNFGQQAAIAAGLSYSTGDAVVVLDADLQDPPEAVTDLLRAWRAGHQVVHAIREKREDRATKRALASGFYRLLTWVSPIHIPRDAGEFVLLDRVVVDIMNALPEEDRYLRGLRAWCGFRQAEVPYERSARAGGRPQYTFWKSLTLAIDGLVSFSTAPLRLATYLGLASVAAALVAFVWAIGGWMSGGPTSALPAPPVSMSTIALVFLAGAQLTCLGIVGEYLGRIAKQVKGRPLWIAEQTVGLGDARVAAIYPGGPARPTSFGRSTTRQE